MKFLLFALTFCSLYGAPLTLQTCREIALDKNPMSRAAKEGIWIATFEIGKSKAPYYFQADVSASYSRWQTHAFIPTQLQNYPQFQFSRYGPFDDYGACLYARYLLFDCGNRQAELKQALLKRGIARQDEEKIRQEIILNVSGAFYSLAANLELLKVNEKKLERAQSHLELAKKRKEVGAVAALDVYRAKVGLADAQQELVKVKGIVRISKGNLNTSMGLAPNCEIEIESVEGELASPLLVDVEHSLDEGLQKRPELKASECRILATCEGVNKARSEFGPQVWAQGSYGRRGEDFFPQTREFYAGVGLRWNVFNGWYSTYQLQQAKSEVRYEKNRHEQLALAIQQEIWRSHSQLLESWEMINTTNAQLEDAKESHRLAKERYENGSSTINDLLDSQTVLSRSEAIHVEARWNYKIAETSFDWAMGRLGF
jgi:outer membrane protein TolC